MQNGRNTLNSMFIRDKLSKLGVYIRLPNAIWISRVRGGNSRNYIGV